MLKILLLFLPLINVTKGTQRYVTFITTELKIGQFVSMLCFLIRESFSFKQLRRFPIPIVLKLPVFLLFSIHWLPTPLLPAYGRFGPKALKFCWLKWGIHEKKKQMI